MDIVCKIVNSVKEKFDDRSKDAFDAVFAAYEYMNSELTKEELDELVRFSKRVEHRDCSNLKSLYDAETSEAIWSIGCWAVSCLKTVEKVNEILYSHSKERYMLSMRFTEEKAWELYMNDWYLECVKSQKLQNYSGVNLFFEIVDAIKKFRK